MAEPLTLASIGAVALTEGIRFLYGQATELLKRVRDRRKGEKVDEEVVVAGDVLDAPLGLVRVDYDRATEQREAIKDLRLALGEYVDGIEAVDPSDPALVESAHALRQLLESVYGRRITFRGETREGSGAVVDVQVVAEQVDGYVAAVRANRIGDADVTARVSVKRVAADGEAVGLDVDELG